MKNFTTNPAMTWQLALSASACATSALPTIPSQGTAVRQAPNAAFAPFADAVATDVTAIKRERALTGMGHRGTTVAYVLGSPAWSHPN